VLYSVPQSRYPGNVVEISSASSTVLPLTGGESRLAAVLQNSQLHPVFQPIIQLSEATVYAHEALIRGPVGSDLYSPDALLAAAAAENLAYEFEMACIQVQLHAWNQRKVSGRLFLNISATTLIEMMTKRGIQGMVSLLSRYGVLPRMIVLEITEHERVADMDQMAQVVHVLRATGISLALDDFGDGRSSLRLWSQLRPEVVKVDKYFIMNISEHPDKLKTVRALLQLAEIFETELVAEGIETPQDLRVLRDLGITFGQGYFFGRPDVKPLARLDTQAIAVLHENEISVYPQTNKAPPEGFLNKLSILNAPAVTAQTTNDEVATLFLARPDLHALAVVDEGRPVAIVNRLHFINEYAKLYYRDIFGRKSCMLNANPKPRLIEKSYRVDDLVGILTSEDQRYLTDGFVVTDNGHYVGLGTGDQLVRSVTETRMEAARHANPLTNLPGNIPISQHIGRLLKKRSDFVACYADLNNFKPYNDCYGYWRGDEMICLMAKVAKMHCDSQRDFLGHVGGDDFIVLFQSSDWKERCESMVSQFNAQAIALYDESAKSSGGIHAEDRHGVARFFPFTTVSIGAVAISGGQFFQAEDVANLAALAKHDAKRAGAGLFVRSSPVTLPDLNNNPTPAI
jgi:diguanylate cyclase (GGDEF)-like protein